jgi:hypothetical protein
MFRRKTARLAAEAHVTGRAAEERLLRDGVKKILTADCTDNADEFISCPRYPRHPRFDPFPPK